MKKNKPTPATMEDDKTPIGELLEASPAEPEPHPAAEHVNQDGTAALSAAMDALLIAALLPQLTTPPVEDHDPLACAECQAQIATHGCVLGHG